MLVAVEGIDGGGKSTVASILAQWCGERGFCCTFSKEPTSLKYGQQLRESANTGRLSVEDELELFREDRIEHVKRSIGPALAANEIVILDRYYWSTAAYQGSRGVDVRQIIADNEAVAPVPDLILLLDVEVRSGIQRIRGRGDTPNDFEEIQSLENARSIFLQLHERGDRPSVLIRANRDLRAVCQETLSVFKRTALKKIAAAGGNCPSSVLELFA